MPSLKSVVALAAAVAPASAFWRMECRGVAGYYRMDPIISPGEAAEHLHSILGSGGFSESATFDDLNNSNCTSCLVTQDKSAYWHPALYFKDSTTGDFELVGQVGGTLAYYLLYTGNGNSTITAFPDEFRMIAGNQNRRSYTAGNVEMVDPPKSEWASLGQTTQEVLAQRALGFNCLDYSATPEASLYRHFFPNKEYLDANCPDGIRFELMFPSCWNGVDTDSANHRDHMAYPDEVMSGDCPEGFLTRVPSLFYETIWDTASFASRSGEFVISNGDVEGFAYHADFMMGWDAGVLQQAIDTCTSSSGEISDCPIFNIQTQAEAQNCKVAEPANLSGDNAKGPAPSLPGDVAVYGSALVATMIATYDAALSAVGLPTEATDGVVASATSVVGSIASKVAGVATSIFGDINKEFAPTTSSSATTQAPSSTATPTPILPTVATVPSIATVPSVSSPSSTSTTSSTLIPASSPAPSSAPTVVTAAAVGQTVISTQYVTNNGVVTEIHWYETTVYSTEEETATVTATVAARDAHNHLRRHGKWRRQGHNA
ncbi:wsc domain containing protein [Grosmannia clavigera kw1407]|uniref:Wsc domain containing protein n=1 Tax=Grosmannia clavigera (strain kw1407 / UAMH 11150) TaxID=655863 RepID=F0XKZ6_GROCL|nr:wsc domain containing protein [Grosmannia clavigera kw1407]EFX01586.1 wsc domain containing protein [Grosmannia clavigera kw1407]